MGRFPSATGCGSERAFALVWGRVHPGQKARGEAMVGRRAPLAGVKPAPQGSCAAGTVGAGAWFMGPGSSRPKGAGEAMVGRRAPLAGVKPAPQGLCPRWNRAARAPVCGAGFIPAEGGAAGAWLWRRADNAFLVRRGNRAVAMALAAPRPSLAQR